MKKCFRKVACEKTMFDIIKKENGRKEFGEKMKTLKKIGIKKIYLFVLTFTLFLFFILASFIVVATPVPKGVDGYVFYSDGTTEVFANIPIELTNLNTNETIEGYTGRGSSGRYSFAVSWDLGTNISVKAYNPLHSTNRTIILDGVIHNFNLILNMTLPNYAPEATINPQIKILVGQKYLESLDVFDWNNDDVSATLIVYPEGMTVERENDNLFVLNWTPTRYQTGVNRVSINISDGVNEVIREFDLNVLLESNNPPEITSDPETEFTIFQKFTYQIEAEDPDGDDMSYYLLSAPSNVNLDGNIISWTPNEQDIGLQEISFKVEDEFGAYDTQTFWVNVIDLQNDLNTSVKKSNSGISRNILVNQSGNQTNQSFTNENKNKINFSDTKEIWINESGWAFYKLTFYSQRLIAASMMVFSQLEKNYEKPSTQVYQYAELDVEDKDPNLSAKINFAIQKKWIISRNLEFQDIVLDVLRNNEWLEVPVTIVGEDAQNLFFESKNISVDERMVIAITHKKDKLSSLPEPDVTKIKEAFILMGRAITKKDTEKICFSLMNEKLDENVLVEKTSKEDFKEKEKIKRDKLNSEREENAFCINVSDIKDEKYQVTINSYKNQVLQVYTVAFSGQKSKVSDISLSNKINIFDINEKGLVTKLTGEISDKANKIFVILIIVFFIIIIFSLYLTRRLLRKFKNKKRD